MPNNIGVDIGGIIPQALWQTFVAAVLAAIGWGVRRVVMSVTKLSETVGELSTLLAVTSSEMKIRNEMADHRYEALTGRMTRLESQQDLDIRSD